MTIPNRPYSTEQVLAMDRHLVHCFADLNALKEEGARTAIGAAKGVHVWDCDGNKLLDGIGGLWCTNVGHGRDEIIDAIASQLRELDYYSVFYNLTHPSVAALSEKLAALAPGPLNHTLFGNSGSVANDSAVRILHHYNNRLGKTSKKKILSRVGAYHGSTHMAVAMTTPAYRAGWDSADELVHFLSSPYAYRRPDGMDEAQFLDFLIDEMKDTIEKLGAENIAAFIGEPVMGAGGVIVPPDGYHKRAADLCSQYDIKVISDEVVTAFGRLGHMFASEAAYGFQPDIITTAKGLTSGYQPMSATIMSDEIFDVVSGPDGIFLHGMTYSGHPACAAAALANIAIIEREDICGHVRKHGPLFEKTLHSLSDLPIVGEVRGSHFMMGIEFVCDKASKEVFDPVINVGRRVAVHAQERGLIVRPLAHMAVLSPPLVLTEAEIGEVGDILRQAIQAAADDLAAEGLF
jgi:adenosylmethionine-8-amino-7-oxononanoate aminotransferase